MKTNKSILLDRRQAMLAVGMGSLALVGATSAHAGMGGHSASSYAPSAEEAAIIQKAATAPDSSRVSLKMPAEAFNGGQVDAKVTVDSPMSADDHVKAIHIVAAKNPNPLITSIFLTPAMGKAEVSTRVRLAGGQTVVALVEMSDGSVMRGSADVQVKVGGCGG